MVFALLKVGKVSKLWPIAGLGSVVLIAAAGVWSLIGPAYGSGQDSDVESRLVTVPYGNVVTEVAIDGKLVFPRRVEMTFGVGGTVGEVLVKDNQNVKAGQILAKLDAVKLADLEKSMASGPVSLRSAQEALDTLLISSPVSLAKAEALVAEADVVLDDAREDLDELLHPEATDIARAQEAVADARLALDDAEDGLADLDRDHAQRWSQARQARAKAEVALDQAREGLSDSGRYSRRTERL